jgi:DNA-directed RNA polymerase subunit RPC12/RpoP
MYECLDCGAEFNVPSHSTIGFGSEAIPVECCPDCGSDDILCDVEEVDDLFDELED